MLFRAAPVVVLTALLAQSALATFCPAGKYHVGTPGNYQCLTCPAGTYQPNNNSLATSCTPCPAGKGPNADHSQCVTCPAGTISGSGTGCQNCPAGKENNANHTQCVPCPAGEYSTGGTTCQACPSGQIAPSAGATSCQPCPAGKGPSPNKTSCTPCGGETYSTGGTSCMNCPAGSDANPGHTGCDKCPKGWYNGNPGGQCKKCDGGSFNNVSGSTSCTKCNGSTPYSNAGSANSGDCKSNKGPRPNPATSCDMIADNVCPNPTGPGPVGTAITRKRQIQCTKGFTSCPRLSGTAGFDCVDTENDPESCGGCVGLDGSGSGTDCTAIKGTSATSCVKGSCVIGEYLARALSLAFEIGALMIVLFTSDSCRKGWVKSLDGTSCVPASETDGLHAQDTNTKKIKRSSAKRAIRHTLF
ncbi:hypothetical protein FS837_010751 [Tulasnella sp. UAMH 9824]|nr:hypothetical protein FS837_010751 [Tulasnella sp. UAMH 9824]